MPTDDDRDFFPPTLSERPRPQASRKVPGPQANRTVLGVLLALLGAAVLLALWFLVFDGDDSDDAETDLATAAPTAIVIPTLTAIPIPADGAPDETNPAVSTTVPAVTPTPLPAGFEACAADRLPSATGTYTVDTNTTPLNQRSEPAVGSELAGTFEPGSTGLTFTGNCVVNVGDGYVWWEIHNGTANVWIASDFVTPG